ncbi:MAG: hypothetical protein HZA88_12580 [Verrucomicrobia bacterium]|nr:hypothetical protein [Verrucomicrobiota bacterium]
MSTPHLFRFGKFQRPTAFPSSGLSRRQFLHITSATTAVTPLIMSSDAHAASPNGKLQHACIGGEMTESHFGQTSPMAEAILLGTVAVRVPSTKSEWDAAAMKIINNLAANRLLRRTYRKGWPVEGL